MNEIMKGITCCADCAYYNMKKHKCTRATDEGKPTDQFYADCPLPTVTNAQGWISVKDRLPDAAGYKCLVMAINKFGQKSVFTAHTGYGDFEWYTTDVIYMNKVNRNTVSDAWTITHWTPLPELPKEDEDDDE